MKRILTCLLAVICVAALAFSADAAKETELSKEQEMIRKARLTYSASLASAGKTSFHGFCGLMTSHQLYHAGINAWCIINDGNKQFDYYSALDKTTGGYYVNPYYLEDYSMEEALNQLCRNGTRDVYNILVCFQWTNTGAGAAYGHAVFINAILDGVVYFVEGFPDGAWGREGTVVQFAVEEFANYYSGWCTYEGLIHFGGYLDTCEDYTADVFIRARFETAVRSLPDVVGQEDCTEVRKVAAGELLHADTLLQTPRGDWFYRVQGGYISANAVMATQGCGDRMTLSGFSLPEQMEENTDPELSGLVVGGDITAVTATITDAGGAIILRERMEGSDLAALNEPMQFDLLVPGWYRVEIAGEAASTVLQGGQASSQYVRRVLLSTKLRVGQVEETILSAVEQQAKEGWVHQQGKWYCYRLGKPCTGWLTDRGVGYYLDDTGAALTGWQELEGGKRYFTETGAMVTGWLTVEEGTYYLDDKGVPVIGTVTLGGQEYTFNEMGILQE